MKNPLFYLAWKLLFTRKFFLEGSAPLSLLGLILGVASLLVSMAVMSGFESTLKNTMTDVSGHIQIVDRTRSQVDAEKFLSELKEKESSILYSTPFVYVESVLANKGQIVGALLQGLSSESYQKVVNLDQRVIHGKNSLVPMSIDGHVYDSILIGKGIAKRFDFKVGDILNLVVPVSSSIDPNDFKRQAGEFVIAGVLDFGKHDWNERLLITDIKAVQKLAAIGSRFTGLILKIKDPDSVRDKAFHLSQKMGPQYLIRDWRDVNENLFDAVAIERVVIFLVILIIVLVAAFNVASTLYVGVVQRHSEIAILKSLGVSQKQVLQIFTLQGLILGLFGVILGLLVGWVMCLGFSFVQSQFELIPGSVYKIDNILIKIRLVDVFYITLATTVICFIATLAPARSSSRMSVVEGLRNG